MCRWVALKFPGAGTYAVIDEHSPVRVVDMMRVVGGDLPPRFLSVYSCQAACHWRHACWLELASGVAYELVDSMNSCDSTCAGVQWLLHMAGGVPS